MADPGLPENIPACLCDLDGVVSRTAAVHEAAWKQAFDAFLRERDGADFRPFTDADYVEYVDGRPRTDGVRTFLASRGVGLPPGAPDDPPGAATVHGLARRKNELFPERIRSGGVEAYDGTLRSIEAARADGLRTAVVSACADCRDVLRAPGAEHPFDARVDGVEAAERDLPGKPRPGTFLAAARDLGVPPGRAAVFEDAPAGMDAGGAGRFGYVVGVDRVGRPRSTPTAPTGS
ncbi:beta-phosphoglucomutase family hydrolase [Streptomyces incanus]